MSASPAARLEPTWFVVTGCSRSGTGFAARLFQELGFVCGHERTFRIDKVAHGDPLDGVPRGRADGAPRGDSSFLAAPFVADLPPGSVVLHQLRDPLEVIRSHLGIGFFAEPFEPSWWLADEHPDILAVIRRHAPSVLAPDDELRRCMRYWVVWNHLVGSAAGCDHLVYVRYRVEDLRPELVRHLLHALGQVGEPGVVAEVLRDLPTDINTRPRDESVRWADLPAGADLDGLLRTAARYGYDTPT